MRDTTKMLSNPARSSVKNGPFGAVPIYPRGSSFANQSASTGGVKEYPSIDGLSRHVADFYVHSGVTPLVHESQPLDPYPAHFSALTKLVGLTLAGHRGKAHLDVVLQYFQASVILSAI